MAATYCAATDVGRLLNFTFSGSTTPTTTQVEDYINASEDQIDKYTMHAFRSVTVTKEYHNMPPPEHRRYTDAGTPVFLQHRKITVDANGDLESGTDLVEVWDGSSWVDWVASSDFTQGRGGDFWVEPDKGIVWIRSPQYSPRVSAIRVTYRYGESSVPNDIKEACALLSASRLLTSDDRGVFVVESGDGSKITNKEKAEWFKKHAFELLENHIQFGVGRN